MPRNIELLTKIRDLIVAKPKKLEMGNWGEIKRKKLDLKEGDEARISCGTTHCIAGWAAQLSGDKFIVSIDNLDEDEDGNATFYPDRVATATGQELSVHDRARDLLGLTGEEAEYLFLSVGNRGAVRALDGLIDGRKIYDIYTS